MEKVEFINLNHHNCNLFLKNIIHVIRRKQENDKAKNTLKSNVHTIRNLVRSKRSRKSDITRLLMILDRDIDEAIEKGSRTIKHTFNPESDLNPLYSKMDRLEGKLDRYLLSHGNGHENTNPNAEVKHAKKQHYTHLKVLEQKLIELKKLNKYDTKQLNRVKSKIDELKKVE